MTSSALGVKSRFGLRGRLMILVGLAVSPILLAGVLGFTLQYRHLETDARHELQLSAQLMARNVEQMLDSARGLLAAGAVSPVVRRLSPDSCSRHMKAIVEQNPIYLDLGLVGRDGKIVCNTFSRGGGLYVGDRPYIAAAFKSGRFSVSDYQIGRVTGRAALAMAYPVIGFGGKVDGVLVMSLDLAGFGRLLGGIDLHPGATFTMLDRRGVVMIRIPEGERWVGKDANSQEVARTAMRQREGVTVGLGLDGVRRMFAFLPLRGDGAGSGIMVGLGLPESAVFRAMRRDLGVVLGFALLALLGVSALTALYGERSLLRPLRAITDAARRLGAGDWGVRTGLKGRDEIGVLGLVLDRTAASLGALTRQNRLILANAHEGICFDDAEGKTVFANSAAALMLGYGAEELLGRELHALVHHSREDGTPLPEEACPLHSRGYGSPRSGETVFWKKDGKGFPVSFSYASVLEEGRLAGAVTVFRDITEQRRLERQLLQSQKLEVMGRLAGGVAHDFNNLLTAILGFAGFLKESLGPEDERRSDAEEIVKAAHRAADLTRQLLLFTRSKPTESRVLSLSELAANQLKMLRRIVGQGVEIRETLQPELGRTLADPGQVEQAILNLVVNARDAMPGGGVIALETADAELSGAEEGLFLKGESGPQVRLTVRDSGSGMEAPVFSRLFEPFFTTKEAGKGTGLGLAIVHAVVARHKGSIAVQSSRGNGAEFSLYFPRSRSEAVEEGAAIPAASRRGTETILIVENDDPIRKMIRRALESHGYRVLDASGLEEALAVSGDEKGVPDLLLTDVILRGARGPEVALRLKERIPGLKVLYVTGYAGEQPGLPEEPLRILRKPFTSQQLLERVRLVLDGKA